MWSEMYLQAINKKLNKYFVKYEYVCIAFV